MPSGCFLAFCISPLCKMNARITFLTLVLDCLCLCVYSLRCHRTWSWIITVVTVNMLWSEIMMMGQVPSFLFIHLGCQSYASFELCIWTILCTTPEDTEPFLNKMGRDWFEFPQDLLSTLSILSSAEKTNLRCSVFPWCWYTCKNNIT